MHGSSHRSGGSGTQTRGPETYLGYCRRSKQYRMMDLPDFMDNTQAGLSQMVAESTTAMQRMWYPGAGGGTATSGRQHDQRRKHGDCGCGCGCDDDCGCGGSGKRGCECHCECCVCDSDVLLHARCGEVRRIPLTFENDTRRDTPVTLTLEKFVTAGGRDLGWTAALSETQFTLHPCDEHTVSLAVRILCKSDNQDTVPNTNAPATPTEGGTKNPNSGKIAGASSRSVSAFGGANDQFGSVDKCDVGYATIRAEGCLTRPIVVAIAVLPDDCDASRHGCGCGCCGD
jgi:hypothetical protein